MIERYAIYCKNMITGEWMHANGGFFTQQGAASYAELYTNIGFEVEIREYQVSIF